MIAIWHIHGGAVFTLIDRLQGVVPVTENGLPRAYAKTPLPFFDMAGVLSWPECAAQGYDVMSHNPCDPYGRVDAYSPLIHHLPLGWIGVRNTIPAGLALGLAFLICLVPTMAPEKRLEFAIAALACVSPSVFFALERANLDMLIFSLVMGAMMLPQRGHWVRLASYAAAFIGGLLKFYPFAFLIIMMRERLRYFIGLSAVALAGLALYVGIFWNELVRLPRLLPADNLLGTIGARVLSNGLTAYGGLPGSAGVAVHLLLGAISLWGALLVAQKLGAYLPDPRAPDRRMALLLAGSVIMTACFHVGVSIYYRAIFLLPVLPGLFALHGSARDSATRKLLALAVSTTLFCLYGEMVRVLGTHFVVFALGLGPQALPIRLARLVILLINEGAWWFEVTVLTGVVIAFLRRSASLVEFINLFAVCRRLSTASP